MDIPSLIDICLAYIAYDLLSMDVDTMRSKFGIEEEFTPEVEKELRAEFKEHFTGDKSRLYDYKLNENRKQNDTL